MEIIRLKKENYDDLLCLLNEVFTVHNKKPMDFEKELPKMCVRDDRHMQKHFGIFENGRLVSAVGIYPLPVNIAGERLLFSTVGNVATHPDFEGKGYMNVLLRRAMQELDDIGADASRLGGLRHRYNRFGYEMCGSRYTVAFNEQNRKNNFSDIGSDITFKKIEASDLDLLKIAHHLHGKGMFAAERSAENGYADMYNSMTAWQCVPYAAVRDGEMIGYLCSDPSGDSVAEHCAKSPGMSAHMLCAWQKHCGKTLSFNLFPYDIESVGIFYSKAERMTVGVPSLFKIIRWERVISALMKLKASYTEMSDGELKIEIKDYGVLRLYVNGSDAGCERTVGTADVVLDRLQAARYIFGPLSPEYTASADRTARNWFPLPLSWNPQDRV